MKAGNSFRKGRRSKAKEEKKLTTRERKGKIGEEKGKRPRTDFGGRKAEAREGGRRDQG
jgi:hypothetical protein